MDYIDPHIHMVSRTTDDYETLARMGCVAMSEPAFWAGFDRGSVESFRDYFRQLTQFEPKRAAQFGIQHYTPGLRDIHAARKTADRCPRRHTSPFAIGATNRGHRAVTGGDHDAHT